MWLGKERGWRDHRQRQANSDAATLLMLGRRAPHTQFVLEMASLITRFLLLADVGENAISVRASCTHGAELMIGKPGAVSAVSADMGSWAMDAHMVQFPRSTLIKV